MAASTAAREDSRKDGLIVSYAVQTAVKINKGTLVSVDNTGYVRPARSGTATDAFVGVAYESADNTSGSAGAVSVRVCKTGSSVFAKASAVIANVGAAFYAADDQTLTATSTNNQLVGYCVGLVDSANVRIRIDRAVN